jgi:hypothetical protein
LSKQARRNPTPTPKEKTNKPKAQTAPTQLQTPKQRTPPLKKKSFFFYDEQ